MDMTHATPQDAQDSVRDAAALLLAYVKQDISMVQAISENSSIPTLLSGLLFVSGLVVIKAFEQDVVEAMESLVEFLANVPDDFWTTMAAKATVVDGKYL